MMVPKEIKKLGDRGMNFVWPDGHESEFDAVTIRENCRCAGCRHELTGKRILQPGSVAADIKILKSEVLGNYALGFVFSDGHSTGIFSYDYLREICPCCIRNQSLME